MVSALRARQDFKIRRVARVLGIVWFLAFAVLHPAWARAPGTSREARAPDGPGCVTNQDGHWMCLERVGGSVLARFGFPGIVDRDAQRMLDAGFRLRIRYEAGIGTPQSQDPLARPRLLTRVVLLDLWEDLYRVESTGGSVWTWSTTSRQLALEAVSEVRCLSLVPAAALPASGQVLAGVRAVINPVDEDERERTRLWLLNPAGHRQGPTSQVFDLFLGWFIERGGASGVQSYTIQCGPLSVNRLPETDEPDPTDPELWRLDCGTGISSSEGSRQPDTLQTPGPEDFGEQTGPLESVGPDRGEAR